MANFKIELRLTIIGPVMSWEVFLENTNSSSRVLGWAFNIEKKYFFRVLEGYPVLDENLDVFVGCEGREGGKASCTVIINDKEQSKKVVCRNTDPNYAHQSYKVELAL